jgi:hypothetical protein
MATRQGRSTDDTEIRQLIDGWTRAVRAKDVNGVCLPCDGQSRPRARPRQTTARPTRSGCRAARLADVDSQRRAGEAEPKHGPTESRPLSSRPGRTCAFNPAHKE